MTDVRQGSAAGELLALAIADPDRAEAIAHDLLSGEAEPGARSVAHQARGIVWRDRGLVDTALDELRTAVRLAHESSDGDREADARATLGLTLTIGGRTRSGLEQLDRALAAATDPGVRARILTRRGHALYFMLLRPREALDDLEAALPAFRSLGDRIWEARTLNLIGLSRVSLGQTDLATSAVQQAEDIFEQEGQATESVVTVHNRAAIAWCRGDLPGALRLYDEAAEKFAALGEDHPGLVRDRCDALLAAGLTAEAVELVARRIALGSLPAPQEAELWMMLASAQLAVDPEAADASASRAREMFTRQRRGEWAVRAELFVLLARYRRGRRGRRLAEGAASVAGRLGDSIPEEGAVAWLLAGRLALDAGLPEAARLLERAATYRAHPSELVRATAWRARALRCESEADRRGTLAACRRGLDALDRHRASLGKRELRALVAHHGDELASLALRHAAPTGPRALLEWSERWRANALSQPAVRPPDDEHLARDLATLRDTRRRLAEAIDEGSPLAARLDEDRSRLELAIRRRTHRLGGMGSTSSRFRAEELLDGLRDTTFVELVDVDGVLHVLVARARRVTHVIVGATAEAEQAAAFARFALRQAARGRPSDLDDVGRRLQDALLGDAVRHLRDRPVVVSPPGRLHATPWTLVPALTGVPVSVAPSAALWLRARSLPSPTGHRVLIAGPGLDSGGAELDGIARRHRAATLLRGGSATVEQSLHAMDGASVAHVAAHGRFREDSPMFSSLDLHDGPLTVHDLERLDRAPHRIVLSACESGVVAPIGAGEMLGLVSAMLTMGSAGIISSVAKVNDHATAELMLDVHAAMDEGEDLGHVLLRARQAARRDRVREATAAAFLAMGV